MDVFKAEEKKDSSVQTESVNTDMPDPNMEDLDLKTKYQSMKDNFGKSRDYAAVQGVDAELKVDKDGIRNTLYSDKEIAELDSLEEAKRRQLARLREMQGQQVENRYSGGYPSPGGDPENQYSNQSRDERDGGAEELRKQLVMLQKIAGGENAGEDEKTAGKKNEAVPDAEEKKEQEKVSKVEKKSMDYFNTVAGKQGPDEGGLVKAMVDESLKVVDGSRIRLRLMDEVTIEGRVVPKGTYLYAVVSGFEAQRVKAEVSSILFKSDFLKVSLSIYDTDGIEGLYVPESLFRELRKDASSQALSQNLSMQGSSGEQNAESMMFQTLQNIYQSASSAISNNIKRNKAKLKYNTSVYLINKL